MSGGVVSQPDGEVTPQDLLPFVSDLEVSAAQCRFCEPQPHDRAPQVRLEVLEELTQLCGDCPARVRPAIVRRPSFIEPIAQPCDYLGDGWEQDVFLRAEIPVERA